MLTFQTLYTETQQQVQDSDATSLVLIKRAINVGAKKFGAILNREWRVTYKTFSVTADQQFYQTPEDCIRIKSVTVTIGNIAYPLTEIEDEETWRLLNTRTQTSSIPEFFFVRGNDEFGIYPTPSATVASAGELAYERRMRDMSQDDYTAGTIAVTNNNAAVVGTGTTFTALMVNRWLKINDASGDGMWYKVSTFTDTTHITLENTFAGSTASGLSYAIGEIPDIPEEFHENLIDYACYRYYLRRKDVTLAGDFKALYTEGLTDCKAMYGSKTTSNYYKKPRIRQGFRYWNRDLKVTP